MSADPKRAEESDALVRYVLGTMDLDERMEFEVWMSEDQALATEVERAIAMDARMRAAALEEQVDRGSVAALRRPRRRTVVRFITAAAAVIVVSAWLFLYRGAALELEVTVVSLGRTLADYNEELGLDPHRIPRGNVNTTRGGDPTSDWKPVEADAYYLAISKAEERRTLAALESAESEFVAAFFAIPVRATSEFSALVVKVGVQGECRVEWPMRRKGVALDARLAADEIHYLPDRTVGPPVSATEVGRGRRFVKGRGAAPESWIVGARAEPVPATDFAELDGLLESASRDEEIVGDEADRIVARVTAWLKARGFVVRELRILED